MLINVQDLIKKSWSLYVKNFKKLIPYMLLLLVPNLILSATGLTSLFLDEYARSDAFVAANTIVVLLIIAAAILFSIWTNIALVKSIKEMIMGKEALGIKPSLKSSSHLIFPVIYTSIITFAIILVGMLLLVVPGVIFAIWYAFVYYVVIFEEKGGIKALQYSKKLVAGRWWAILWRLLAPGLFFGFILFLINKLFLQLADLIVAGADQIWVGGVISTIWGVIIAPLTILPAIILYLNAKDTPTTPPVDKTATETPDGMF